MLMRYLDPKNDLTFKKVFGEHPHLLRSFLNAMLPLSPKRQIVSLEYLIPTLINKRTQNIGKMPVPRSIGFQPMIQTTRRGGISPELVPQIPVEKKGREEGFQEALARLLASGLQESEARKMLGI